MSEKKENSGNLCPVCGIGVQEPLLVSELPYGLCDSCGSVTLNPQAMLDGAGERGRYLKHNNSLADRGYRAYLEAFLDGILNFEGLERDSIQRVFDYGSGPSPALVALLGLRGFDARGWDPYFDPHGEGFEGGADLVTCLEVAEHFRNPVEGFRGLSGAARPGGTIAVATHLLSSDREETERDFPAWWYRQDPTHVTFYTRGGLEAIAERAGLSLLGSTGSNTYIFRRETVE